MVFVIYFIKWQDLSTLIWPGRKKYRGRASSFLCITSSQVIPQFLASIDLLPNCSKSTKNWITSLCSYSSSVPWVSSELEPPEVRGFRNLEFLAWGFFGSMVNWSICRRSIMVAYIFLFLQIETLHINRLRVDCINSIYRKQVEMIPRI